MTQRKLTTAQIEAFYHDEFVEDQVRHFIALVTDAGRAGGAVLDVGGGCGFFARRLAHLTGCRVTVLDTDPASIETCRRHGVQALQGDALDPPAVVAGEVVSFNLILHHLVGGSERVTRELQCKALAAWRTRARAVFVSEYIYESYVGNLAGRLIFAITSSKILSTLGRAVSRIVPSLRANTFGVGVRFRAHAEWVEVFRSAGYQVAARVLGEEEPVSMPRRLLLIRSIRRDSFLLTASS